MTPTRQFVNNTRNVVAIAVVTALAANLSVVAAAMAADAPAPGKTVAVAIDYGDATERRFTAIAWSESMTVLDALSQAAKHPRGVKFEHRGQGATALVVSIDGVRNEGGQGRNWLYEVNGKLADRGCGVMQLQAGDAVRWKYERGLGLKP